MHTRLHLLPYAQERKYKDITGEVGDLTTA